MSSWRSTACIMYGSCGTNCMALQRLPAYAKRKLQVDERQAAVTPDRARGRRVQVAPRRDVTLPKILSGTTRNHGGSHAPMPAERMSGSPYTSPNRRLESMPTSSSSKRVSFAPSNFFS